MWLPNTAVWFTFFGFFISVYPRETNFDTKSSTADLPSENIDRSGISRMKNRPSSASMKNSVLGTKVKRAKVPVVPAGIDIHCAHHIYKPSQLDKAASDACSLSRKNAQCRDKATCLPLKKLKASRLSTYRGQEIIGYGEGPFLSWKMSKKNLFQRKNDHIIVVDDPRIGCKAISGITMGPKGVTSRCITKYNYNVIPTKEGLQMHNKVVY